MWGQDQGGSGRGMREPLAGGGADDPQLASINDMMGSLDDAQLRYLQSLTEAQIRDAIHDMGFEIPASMVPQLIVNARAMLADRARDNAPADEPPPRGSPPSDDHGRSVQDYYNDGGHGSHREDGGHKSGRDFHREDDDSYDEPPRHAPPPAARPSHDRAALDQLRELMEDPGRYLHLSPQARNNARGLLWEAWDKGVLAPLMGDADRVTTRALVTRVRRLPERTQDALSIKAADLMVKFGLEPITFIDAQAKKTHAAASPQLSGASGRALTAFFAELELAVLYHGFLVHGGPRSLRVVTFFVAFALFWCAAIEVFVDDWVVDAPYAGLLLFYVELFTVGAMLLESDALCGVAARGWITRRATALRSPTGRGLFYVFTGTLALGSWTIADAPVITAGLLFALCGLVYMGVGFSAWRKLRALKAEGAGGGGGGYGRGSGEHTEKHCKELFEIYDRDKDGVLDAREFGLLIVNELRPGGGRYDDDDYDDDVGGTTLAQSELEAAMLMLDDAPAGDSTLTYAHFADWYMRRGSHAAFDGGHGHTIAAAFGASGAYV